MPTPYDEWKTSAPEDPEIPDEYFERAKAYFAEKINEMASEMFERDRRADEISRGEDAYQRKLDRDQGFD